MPNPPDPDDTETTQIPTEQVTESHPIVSAEAPTEVFSIEHPVTEAVTEVFSTEQVDPGDEHGEPEPERRFTAPGFDAGHTEVMPTITPGQAEAIRRGAQAPKARPQLIPPRIGAKLAGQGTSRAWGWVLALTLIILTLAAIAVLGTVWLTRDSGSKASQEDRVRETIQSFDAAVQKGDLATLRSITCGSVRDGYVNYNEQAWDDTYRRVEAARQYPVVASIDEVVVDNDRAEANVTAFLAYAPQVRSTRSFDLQYRDDQWKICQARTG